MKKLLFLAVIIAAVSCRCPEPEPPTPPTAEMTNIITGFVTNWAGKAISGAKVSCSFNGIEVASTTADANGEYTLLLGVSGILDLSFTANGFQKRSAVATLSTESEKKADICMVNVVLMPVGVTKKADPGSDAMIPLPKTEYPQIWANSLFHIYQGAVAVATDVTITPMVNIITQNESASGQVIPFIVMECGPAGLTFNKPCTFSIENALTKYTMKNIALSLYDNVNRKWNKQSNAVTYSTERNRYEVSINHFSTYKIGFTDAVRAAGKSSAQLKLPTVNNLNGIRTISLKSVDVPVYGGYDYVLTPEEAVKNAGITGNDATELITLINTAVRNNYEGTAAGIVKSTLEYPFVMDVPVGIAVDFSGSVIYSKKDFTFTINDGNKDIKITVTTNSVEQVVFGYVSYNEEHIGGSN